jgi:hypothetical protein
MPRNMSFMLTTEQIKNKTKTETRRLGWRLLNPGDILNACEKCQGLKKGEKVKVICQIQVVQVWREQLMHMTEGNVLLEGFPDKSKEWFIDMFCRTHKCTQHTIVTRIVFKYI